ncbi:DUF1648 domain-containing protein [Streptomyces sp. M10(2022)]
MNRKNLARVTLVVLPFLLALVVDLVLVASFTDRLPARPATHFAAGGEANGYTDRSTFVLLISLLPVLLGAIWSFMAVRGSSTAGRTTGSSRAGTRPRPSSAT